MRITACSRSGRLTARSTCCTSSSRRGRGTTVRDVRSTSGEPGRGVRSRGGRPARRAAMPTPRPGTCVGPPGMPRTLPARPPLWATWRPMSSVPRPTRSGRCGRLRRKTRVRRPAARSASGNAPSSPSRFGNSCSTTSGCATSCAGSCSTADPASSRCPPGHQVGSTHDQSRRQGGRHLRRSTPPSSGEPGRCTGMRSSRSPSRPTGRARLHGRRIPQAPGSGPRSAAPVVQRRRHHARRRVLRRRPSPVERAARPPSRGHRPATRWLGGRDRDPLRPGPRPRDHRQVRWAQPCRAHRPRWRPGRGPVRDARGRRGLQTGEPPVRTAAPSSASSTSPPRRVVSSARSAS